MYAGGWNYNHLTQIEYVLGKSNRVPNVLNKLTTNGETMPVEALLGIGMSDELVSGTCTGC